jgi:hypothetical protein
MRQTLRFEPDDMRKKQDMRIRTINIAHMFLTSTSNTNINKQYKMQLLDQNTFQSHHRVLHKT